MPSSAKVSSGYEKLVFLDILSQVKVLRLIRARFQPLLIGSLLEMYQKLEVFLVLLDIIDDL